MRIAMVPWMNRNEPYKRDETNATHAGGRNITMIFTVCLFNM
jgi:hypothetical protein